MHDAFCRRMPLTFRAGGVVRGWAGTLPFLFLFGVCCSACLLLRLLSATPMLVQLRKIPGSYPHTSHRTVGHGLSYIFSHRCLFLSFRGALGVGRMEATPG